MDPLMINLLIFIAIVQVIHFLGTWKLYVKAGRQAWEAAIPVYNAYVLTKIINRPWWWTILLFFPIINLLMFPAFWVETARSFGKEKTMELIVVVLTLGFYIYYLNYVEDVTYNKERQLEPYTKLGEWVTSITFAIVAATLVHTYFMRPYTIPTPSLEKSLLVGDYLFVSKFHYGARVPKTPLSLPMVHDTMPIPVKFRSYVKGVELPYMRLPGFQRIKRNDIVVFNWPTDTVRFFRDRSNIHIDKPLDKKSNYVKRCVGIPGDSLEIRDGYIYINGKQTVLPDRADTQYNYTVESKEFLSDNVIRKMGLEDKFSFRFYQMPTSDFDMVKARDFKGIIKDVTRRDSIVEFESYYRFKREQVLKYGLTVTNKMNMNLTKELVNMLKKNTKIKSVTQQAQASGQYNKAIFPHNPQYPWTRDNFGAIYIPGKGDTVNLNSASLPFYKRIIEEYEHNDLAVDGDKIYINGQEANSYTFKQDYYWMMGDNRHNSEDARYWGYVPFDHVVGKPVLIWFSIDAQDPRNPKGLLSRIRWDRLFTTVHGEGKRTSYLYPVLGLIALLFGFSFFKKKKVVN